MNERDQTTLRIQPGPRRPFWVAAVVAALLGGGLAMWLTTPYQDGSRALMRLDVLEQQVRELTAKLEVAAILRAAARHANEPPPHAYAIQCLAPWQELGPIGQGLWGCRTPEPVAGGFYPNCNLTSSAVAPGLSAQQFYATATAGSAQLSAARQLGARAIDAHGRSGYEASFEHDSTGQRLRVLASMFVSGEQVYVVTCSAPPAEFDAVAGRFRAIAASFELKS